MSNKKIQVYICKELIDYIENIKDCKNLSRSSAISLIISEHKDSLITITKK